MAMYYYARKLQKGAKVSQPNSSSSSSSYSSRSKTKQQIPPPPLIRAVTTVGIGGVQGMKRSPSSTSSSSTTHNFLVNGIDHPPCCSMLRRSSSKYENLELGDGDENGGDEDEDEYQHPINANYNSNLNVKFSTQVHKGSEQHLRIIHNSEENGDREIYCSSPVKGSESTYVMSTANLTQNYFQRSLSHESQLKSLGFKESQLISGSWEGLLQLVLPTETHFPDEELLFAFLLCSRLHQPPYLTLDTIFSHFRDRQLEHEDASGSPKSKLTEDGDSGSCSGGSSNNVEVDEDEELKLSKDRVHLLVKFLGRWTQLLPHDFRDDRVMHFVRVIARVCVDVNSEVREEVSVLLANLLSKLTAFDVYEASLRRVRTESSIGEPVAAPSVVTICPNPGRMAEHLTLVELERFSFIGAQELVAQLLRKDRCRVNGTRSGCARASDDTSNPETPNLDAFIAWFRRLSMFVASEICKMSKKKSRCRVMEYWIQVGKECLKIRNFNSLMAILSGLSCRPVARLKKTWNKINCADLVELKTAMDPKNNFSAYRTMYKTSVWRSLRIPEQEIEHYKIIVPYFSLLLRDIYNLNSAYPSILPENGHINLEKYNHLAKLIKEIISWQTVLCHFVKVQSVFNAVQALPIYCEDELMEASYNCEEPDGTLERDHFARLKRVQHCVTPCLSRRNSPSQYLYHI